MVVSGVLEFAIKEVPPDTDEYDPEQYPLWAAADSGDAPTDGRNTDSTDDALSTLQERYASGELNDAEFEDKVERLLESDRDDAQSHLEEDSVMEELEK
ncbi:SHOCT domain-containing protein [Halorubrum sp. ASP121]|nr:SHOCT domain-containing protein [Halorubrum sp. ASP121]